MIRIARINVSRKDSWQDKDQPYIASVTLLTEDDGEITLTMSEKQALILVEACVKAISGATRDIGGQMQSHKIVPNYPPALEHSDAS